VQFVCVRYVSENNVGSKQHIEEDNDDVAT
jgi:hypothetical protein